MKKYAILVLLCLVVSFQSPACAKRPKTDTLSVLAIGNSFSIDGMKYLYDVLKSGGAQGVVLGNLYIGGCTLARHSRIFSSNEAAYSYHHNNDGHWVVTKEFRPLDALLERDWDIITLQQASGKSGEPDSFSPYLDDILEIVRRYCPKAKIYWHMTWAYQADASNKAFEKYDCDQMTMYGKILSTVKEVILSRGDFEGVIPVGTAIQNLRTSLYGDTLTRDGYHLSHDAGRFVAALTWAIALGGTDPAVVTWFPPKFEWSDKQLSAIKEAAANAVKTPFSVTEASPELR